jgi:hypothetical protein
VEVVVHLRVEERQSLVRTPLFVRQAGRHGLAGAGGGGDLDRDGIRI